MANPIRPALPRRLAAIVYDSLLVLPMIMAVVGAATGIAVLITGDTGNDDFSATLPPAIVQGLSITCILLFYSYFWSLKGQTLGMQAWRIRLRRIDGGDIRLSHVARRALAVILSLLPLGAGFLWCLVDRNGRYWHDYLSGTELELLPKRNTAKSG